MIKIFLENGQYIPVIVCDICLKPIEDMDTGTVVFRNDLAEGESSNVLHAHQGNCHDLAHHLIEVRMGKHLIGWDKLEDHLTKVLDKTGNRSKEINHLCKNIDGSKHLEFKQSTPSSKEINQKPTKTLLSATR